MKPRQRVTISDVARHAGVAKSSVSRALNGSGEQNPETARRIKEAARELGYVPAATAQSLAKGRTGTIGLLIPNTMWWPWTLRVMQGVVEAVEEAGLLVTLVTAGVDEESQRMLSRRIVGAGAVDGLVAVLPPGMLGYLEAIDAEGVHVALVDEGELRPGFPSVRADNRGGAAAAVTHLTALTQGKVALIAGDTQLTYVQERIGGYADGLAATGRIVDDTLVAHTEMSIDGGREAMDRLLAAHPDLTGVFCTFDELAVGALQSLVASGRRVPEDVAVVGYDDSELAKATHPGLTSVRQPLREMGAAAAGMVLAWLAGRKLDDDQVLPTSLVVRGSAPHPS